MWTSGWRKKVEWDKEKKVYKYKGHDIFPLSFNEQNEMPLHIQNEYYWDEITRIDRIVEVEQKDSEQQKYNITVPMVDEIMDGLLKFWEM